MLEIQQAMVAHGFPCPITGLMDKCTHDTLWKIADDHKWQVTHVPDARVLGLLGLGGKNFDPEVLDLPQDHLDKLQRNDP